MLNFSFASQDICGTIPRTSQSSTRFNPSVLKELHPNNSESQGNHFVIFTQSSNPSERYPIKFPTDGQQPPSGEVELLSGATIENRAVVAKVYLDTFFKKPTNGERSVFTFANGVNDAEQKRFMAIFRQLAEDPIGIILLYRILVEIFREDQNGQWTQRTVKRYMELKECAIGNQETPWRCMWKKGLMQFSCFHFCKLHKGVYIDAESKLPMTRWEFCPISVYLFHELLHWYHGLQDPFRIKNERKVMFEQINDNPMIKSLFPDGYKKASEDGQNEIWSGGLFGTTQQLNHVYVEEMRTILGCFPGVLPGDELSENLYSLSLTLQHFITNPAIRSGMNFGWTLRIIGGQHACPIYMAIRNTCEFLIRILHLTQYTVEILMEIWLGQPATYDEETIYTHCNPPRDDEIYDFLSDARIMNPEKQMIESIMKIPCPTIFKQIRPSVD
jgi:hypothetical protein